jgi:hypothetical protein
MSWKDVIISPLIVGFIYLFAYLIRSRITDKITKKYFFSALNVKMFGVLFFALMYQFYYRGGDTFGYSQVSTAINSIFWENPIDAIRLLFLDAGEISDDLYIYRPRIGYMFKSDNEWFTGRVVSIFGFTSYATYLPTSFLLGFYAFLGTWKMYQVFYKLYPTYHKLLSFSILYIPSCIFWASGMLKDTIVLGSLGFFFYYFINIFHYKRNIIFSIILCIICFWIIKGIKSYVIYSFSIAAISWLYIQYQSYIKNKILKIFTITLQIIVIPFVVFFILSNVLLEFQQQEAFEKIQRKIEGYHSDHGGRTSSHAGEGDASTYTLGEVDTKSIYGMALSMPAAINVTLFRPYLFEAKKLIVFMSSIESTIFFITTIYLVFFKVGIKDTLISTFSNPYMILCISFTFILGFIVGFTSYNFGVLTRFKTPLMPFYATYLVLLYHQAKQYKFRKPVELKRNTTFAIQ